MNANQIALRNSTSFCVLEGSNANSSVGWIRMPFWNRPRPKTMEQCTCGSPLMMPSVNKLINHSDR